MGAITRAAANNFTTNGIILPAGINDASVASISQLENASTSGALTLISEQTASNDANIDFTSGIDSTYPIYKFEFINIHPASDLVTFEMELSTDGGSSWSVTKTSTVFLSYLSEGGAGASVFLGAGLSLEQTTGTQRLMENLGADNDQSLCGELFLFNPSSTTFVKQYIARTQSSQYEDYTNDFHINGYGNTTSAINAVRFQHSSGNIGSGTIKLYGISGS